MVNATGSNWTTYAESFVMLRDVDNYLVYPPAGEVRFLVAKDYDVCWSRNNATKTWIRFGQIKVRGPGKDYASANLILPHAHKDAMTKFINEQILSNASNIDLDKKLDFLKSGPFAGYTLRDALPFLTGERGVDGKFSSLLLPQETLAKEAAQA